MESNHKREAGLNSQRERGGGETDRVSDNGTQKRGCYKVDCSNNAAAASRQQKPVKNPPKSPAVVLSYPSWWSWFHKTSC